jgi:hypothetical protein
VPDKVWVSIRVKKVKKKQIFFPVLEAGKPTLTIHHKIGNSVALLGTRIFSTFFFTKENVSTQM